MRNLVRCFACMFICNAWTVSAAEYPVPLLPAYPYLADGTPHFVSIADFNNDGRNDVLMASLNSDIVDTNNYYLYFYLQNAAGMLDPHFKIPLPFATSSFAVGDVNNDGKPDVVVANRFLRADVYLQSASGQIMPPFQLPTSGEDVAIDVNVADVDGDGLQDIAVRTSNHLYGSRLYVYRQNASSPNGFESPRVHALAGYYWDLALHDLNRDGRPDLLFTGGGADIFVMTQQANGSFSSAIEYGAGALVSGVGTLGISDLDGNGSVEVVVTGGLQGPIDGVKIYTQEPDGSLRILDTLPSGQNPAPIGIADLNNDNRPDFVVADNGFSAFHLYLQENPGAFSNTRYELPVFYGYGATGYGRQSIALGDINSDGKPDVVVADGIEGLVVYYNSLGTMPTADVEVTASYSPQPAVVGTDVVVSLRVTNHGPGSVSNALVANVFPDLVAFKSADPGCVESAGVVWCETGAIANGDTRTLSIVGVPVRGLPYNPYEYENYTIVWPDIIDYYPLNNEQIINFSYENPLGGVFQFSAATYEVSEGGGSIEIVITRTDGSADQVALPISVTGGTATGPFDYTGTVSSHLGWAHGDSQPKSFTLFITDDDLAEGDETIVVTLGQPWFVGSLGPVAQTTVIIRDNDGSAGGGSSGGSGSTASEGGGGGGGGCSLVDHRKVNYDPMLPVLVLLAFLGVVLRRSFLNEHLDN